MSDLHLPSPSEPDDQNKPPEVRLELTRAGVQEVLSLYSQEQRSSHHDGGFTIRFEDLLAVAREHRITLAAGLLVGILLGGLVLLSSTPLYPVAAQVVLERRDVSSSSLGGGGSAAFIATQAEVMQSHSVVAEATTTIPRAAHLEPEADAATDAIESVQATAVTGTQVVALGYLGPDADHGVRLLSAIVDSYRSVLRDNEQQSQTRKLRAKQAEIEVLESEAGDVEAQLEALRTTNQVLGSAESAATAQASILRNQTEQLTEVRNQRIALENRLAAGGEQLAILDPAIRTLQEQLWQAETELSRVRLTLKPRHPAVEAAQLEVAVLRSQLEASSRATPEALKRDIEASRGLERQLEAALGRERERLTAIERYRRDEEILLTELERVREMSDSRRRELLDQRLVTRLASSGEVGVTARVIEAPTLPEEAAWPKPKLVFSVGAMLGLFAGVIVALTSLRRSQHVWVPAAHAAGEGAEFP